MSNIRRYLAHIGVETVLCIANSICLIYSIIMFFWGVIVKTIRYMYKVVYYYYIHTRTRIKRFFWKIWDIFFNGGIWPLLWDIFEIIRISIYYIIFNIGYLRHRASVHRIACVAVIISLLLIYWLMDYWFKYFNLGLGSDPIAWICWTWNWIIWFIYEWTKVNIRLAKTVRYDIIRGVKRFIRWILGLK